MSEPENKCELIEAFVENEKDDEDEMVEIALLLKSVCKINIKESYDDFLYRCIDKNALAILGVDEDKLEEEFKLSGKNQLQFALDKMKEITSFDDEDFETLEELKEFAEDEDAKERIDSLIKKLKTPSINVFENIPELKVEDTLMDKIKKKFKKKN